MSVEERQKEVLRLFRKDSTFEVGDKVIQFARASEEDLKRIQNLSDDDLIRRHWELVEVMKISFSLMDCELEALIALEMEKREISESKYKEVIRNTRRKIQTEKSRRNNRT